MVPHLAGFRQGSGRAEVSLTPPLPPPVLPAAGDGGPGAGEADPAGADCPSAGGQAAAHAPQDVPQPGSGNLQVRSPMGTGLGSSHFSPNIPMCRVLGPNPAPWWARGGSRAQEESRVQGGTWAQGGSCKGAGPRPSSSLSRWPQTKAGCQGTGGTISMRIGPVPG